MFGEVSPFGAEERRMLHAERRICTTDATVNVAIQGAIILHVLFEYETLPFITSQNPYFEVFVRGREREGRHCGRQRRSRDLRVGPAAGLHVGPLGLADHRRPLRTASIASREPFWAEANPADAPPRVFLERPRSDLRDRLPVLTVFDHFVHLAELTTFGGACSGSC